MKRILSAALAVLLLACALGCRLTSDPVQPPAIEADTPAPTAPPTATPEPTPTPVPTPEPTKSPAEQWAEMDRQFPALRAALSRKTLRAGIYDPSAFGIDASELPEIAVGTEEEYEQYYENLRALINRVAEINRFQLDETDLFAFNTVTESLKAELRCREFILYDEPFLPRTGWHVTVLNEFYGFRIETADDVETYLEAIAYIPVFFGKLITREQARIEHNLFMTEYALDNTLAEIDAIRTAGKDFFGYAYLGASMDAIGMTSEEQAPYLARNEAAVDAVLAAYDELYMTLAGMREHCADANTPYTSVPSLENNAWYRVYLERLAPVVGVQYTYGPEDLVMILSYASMILTEELLAIPIPDDAETAEPAETERTAEEAFQDTLKRLEAEYGALSITPSVQYLPASDDSLFGSVQLRCYFDRPDQSVLYFQPTPGRSLDLSAELNAGVCYFYLRALEQEGLSQAQAVSAPRTYYYGLGFYAVLKLMKERAEDTGSYADYENYYLLLRMLYQEILTANVANLIAMGLSVDAIKENLMPDPDELSAELLDTMLSEAYADPIYYVNLTYGLSRLLLLRDFCSNQLKKRFNERQFLEQYLSFGPSFADMLQTKMDDWCDKLAATQDL